MSEKRTYLDYNATAPLLPEARDAMIAALEETGNPSSVHAEGRRARALVDQARVQVAALVEAKPSEIVFTSGATEANVWALSGSHAAVAAAEIEHESVLAPLRSSGKTHIRIPVPVNGAASLDNLASQLPKGALLVLQWANNETGVIQPVEHAAAIAKDFGCDLHVDAVQGAGRCRIGFDTLGAATMSISAHKLGGPKGVGALVIRDGTSLKPLIGGGGQERRRRAGTENVAAIAGFGAAAVVARSAIGGWEAVARLRDELERDLLRTMPSAEVIGAHCPRLPNTICITANGQLAETLVIKLDLAGIAVSAGAACSSGKTGTSPVLTAMGLAPDRARSAIRISLGPTTTRNDAARLLDAWRTVAKSAIPIQNVA